LNICQCLGTLPVRSFIISKLFVIILINRQAALQSEQQTLGTTEHQADSRTDPYRDTVTVLRVDKNPATPHPFESVAFLNQGISFLKQTVDEPAIDFAGCAG
jgi:hypothetical protein